VERKEFRAEDVIALFDYFDIDVTEETWNHFETLMEVLKLYSDRTVLYGQVWKNYGALNNLVRGATKVDRLMATWWHETTMDIPPMHKDSLDDAYDAINFLVFFIRCAREMNITGQPPERPWKMHLVDGRMIETREHDS
jgi:hypothetical protein